MKKIKAFTDVELLIVIAVIGTLVALLIPALIKAHQKEQEQHPTYQPING